MKLSQKSVPTKDGKHHKLHLSPEARIQQRMQRASADTPKHQQLDPSWNERNTAATNQNVTVPH